MSRQRNFSGVSGVSKKASRQAAEIEPTTCSGALLDFSSLWAQLWVSRFLEAFPNQAADPVQATTNYQKSGYPDLKDGIFRFHDQSFSPTFTRKMASPSVRLSFPKVWLHTLDLEQAFQLICESQAAHQGNPYACTSLGILPVA